MNTDYNWVIFIAVMFFLTSVSYLYIAVSTFMYDVRTRARRDYILTGASLFIFSFFQGIMTIAENDALIHVYWAISFVALSLFAPMWLLFLTNFIKFKHKVYRYLLRVTWLTSAAMSTLCVLLGDIVFRDTYYGNQFSYYHIPVFRLHFVYSVFIISVILILHFKWLHQNKLRRYRRQVSVIILLSIVAAPFIFITEHYIPTFTELTIIPLGAFSLLPVSLFVFYSMRKYKLFGITVSNVSGYTFTSATVPIYVLDHENIITLENRAAIEFLGASSIGRSISENILLNNIKPGMFFFETSFSSRIVTVNTALNMRTCDMALTVETDVFNDAVCKVVVLKDITDINRALDQINEQNNMLTSLNDMAFLFLSQTDESFEERMSAGIKLIADRVGFDKVSVWRGFLKEDRAYTVQVFFWSRSSGGSVKPEGEPEEFNLDYLSSNWERIMSGEIVINGPIKSLSDPVTAHTLNFYGINTAFITPIFIGGVSWGFALFDDCFNERVFDDKATETMRSAAYLIANTIMLKEMENKLESAMHGAIEANNAKSEFLAKMSHEIRTPMNAIIGLTELILREDTSNPVQENAATIKQASVNLLSIINDLLDFSKIEAGNMKIIPVSYSLSVLINDVISIIRMKIPDSNVLFTVNLDRSLPRALIGDDVRIRQVLINILVNAVKYTDSGHISLTVKGEFTDKQNINMFMSVEDTGSGIKQEDLDSLFTEYFQSGSGSIEKLDGVGLGLAITRGIVEAMDGDIFVESEYGKGSTFTVKVPQRVNSPEKLAVVDRPKEKSAIILEQREVYADSLFSTVYQLGVRCELTSSVEVFNGMMTAGSYNFAFISSGLFFDNRDALLEVCADTKIVLLSEFGESVPEGVWLNLSMPVHTVIIANVFNGITDPDAIIKTDEILVSFTAPDARVLVVDDVSYNLRVAQGLLRPYKMSVDLRISGPEAIDAVKAKRYDLVFMDHRMPGMDGVETTERIRALGDSDSYFNKLPIIALTADAVSGMRDMFMQSGFDDFLSKPIDTVVLNSVLEKWIPKDMQWEAAVAGDDLDE